MLVEIVVSSNGVLPVEVQHTETIDPHLRVQHSETIDAHASVEAILAILKATQQGHGSTGVSGSPGGSTSGSTTVTPSLVNVDGSSGGYYDEYSSDYGWWDSGGGIDWGGSNSWSDGPEPSSYDSPTSVHLDQSISKSDGSSGYVNVYFAGVTSDGRHGDQLVTQNLNNVTHEILAATPGLNYVNVSATTNGVHDTHSDHYSGNAVDINQVNGVRVDSAEGRDLALQLEAQALADPNTRYVEGPGGNWARTAPGGQWVKTADLPTMNNHIHWSTFRH